VSTERVRKLRFFEPRQYVSIDYARQDLLVIRLEGGVPAEMAAAIAAGRLDPALLEQLAAAGSGAQEGTASGPESGPGPGLKFAKLPVTPGEPLRLEIVSFLEAVRTRREPNVTAKQGRDALALALAIQAEMAAHAERAGLKDFFESGL
jgi:predicted dehydrogenase